MLVIDLEDISEVREIDSNSDKKAIERTTARAHSCGTRV